MAPVGVIFIMNVSSCLFDLACELKLQIADNVSSVPSSGGEWQALKVNKIVDSSERVYLEVN